MTVKTASRASPLWVYAVLPPVILNIAAIILFGGYYALQAIQPAFVSRISQDQIQFIVYLVIFLTEWSFAILLMRQERAKGGNLAALIAPGGDIWDFRWPMAILLFAVFNALFIAYIPLVSALYGEWPRLDEIQLWQRLFLVIAVPIQAAFCEELIWRGHLIPSLVARGRSERAAIILSAISFALLHGVFLVDKLLLTFLLGIIAGIYYLRERNLLPLMITHLIADVWTFGLSAF
jgi:membrane protease YdiL (CAAX protease family)